ncbi:MAG: efflux RND transporter periplasmic adaptor subunit [Gallionellaceae bacterium]
MKQRIHFLVGATLLLTAVLAGCGSKEGNQPPAMGAAPPPPEVDVVTVATDTAVLTQDLPGRLLAFATAQVRARVDGILEKRMFVEGSDVKANDALFKIDARDYQAAYDSARADTEVARQIAERDKLLLEAKAISQQDYDLAVAKVKQAEAALAKAALDLENTLVPAPIAGRIGRAQVTEGALVGHGEATLLATIEQINPLYVDFTQSGADVMRLQNAIKSGKLKRSSATEVKLVLEDGSIYAHPGKLLMSELAVDPDTGSMTMRARFPNPNHQLLPGMYVQVRLPEGSAANTIHLPQRAVQTGAQGQFVMVVDADGKAAPRPVRTDGMAGGDFVIADGVKVGDQVIVNGLQKARPGSPVKAVPLSADSRQDAGDAKQQAEGGGKKTELAPSKTPSSTKP